MTAQQRSLYPLDSPVKLDRNFSSRGRVYIPVVCDHPGVSRGAG